MKLLLTFAIVGSTILVGVIQYQGFRTERTNSVNGVGGTITLTQAEITRHNQDGDCWIIVDDNVYNVSRYLQVHPGLATTIWPYCGRDGTVGYDTKDAGRPHTRTADSLLTQYLLGPVGATISRDRIEATNSAAGLTE